MNFSTEKTIQREIKKQQEKEETEKVLNQFIPYYYSLLNDQKFEELIKFYKQFTEIVFEGNYYKGEELQNLFNLIITSNIKFEIKSFDYLMSGNHRMNVLVTGVITVNHTTTKNFSEYLHFGKCKDKKNESGYWIQSSIFKAI